MTRSFNQNNYYSNCDFRLTFGLPLEDVFPNGDIHPSLKRLFVVTYRYFLQANAANAIQCLIDNSTLAGYLPKLTDIINALTFGLPFPAIMSFQLLIRTLQHYFDVLPVPLMPRYTDRKHFNWKKLSSEGRAIIQKRFTNEKKEGIFLDKLAEELLRLPRVNLLLIGYFVNFLRSLVYYNRQGQNYNKRAANILINYFSASIFTRSYGSLSKKPVEYTYHPLMLILIVKWPQIQRKCIEIQPQCFQGQNYIYIQASNKLNNNNTKDDDNVKTLSTILERSNDDKMSSTICSYPLRNTRSTFTNLTTSVQTKVESDHKESQTLSTMSKKEKKTSTISLLAYTQKGALLTPKMPNSDIEVINETSLIYDEFYEVLSEFSDAILKNSQKTKSETSLSQYLPLNFDIEPTEENILSSKYNSTLAKDKYPKKVLDDLDKIGKISSCVSLSEFDNSTLAKDKHPKKGSVKLNPIDKVPSCVHLSEFDNLTIKNKKNSTKVPDDLETIGKIPSCVSLSEFDNHDKHDDSEASEPLYAECKRRRSFLRFSNKLSGKTLLKQIKDLTANRTKSDEFMKRHIKYEKLANKNASTF